MSVPTTSPLRLEQRQHLLARRPRVGRGLQHDELALLERSRASAAAAASSGPRSGSRLAVSGVGTQISIASVRASGAKCVCASIWSGTARQALRADVLHVGLTGADRRHLGVVHVDRDHVLACLGESDRERQTDVAHESDHSRRYIPHGRAKCSAPRSPPAPLRRAWAAQPTSMSRTVLGGVLAVPCTRNPL